MSDERKRHRFGGMAARVVWLGGDQYQTELELYEYLQGLREVEWNAGMTRGVALEPEARRLYEGETDIVTRPALIVHPEHPWAVASVDGITFEGDRIVEVKCPAAEIHDRIIPGDVRTVPEDYLVQIRWYLYLTGAAVCDLVSYHPDDPTPLRLVPIPADPEQQAALWVKCQAWYERHIVTNEPPARGPRDVIMRDDKEWKEAAQIYREAEAAHAEWERKKEAARALLLSLMDGALKVAGGGVQVTKYQQVGNLNWSELVRQAKAAGVDVEALRGPPQERTKITVAKS